MEKWPDKKSQELLEACMIFGFEKLGLRAYSCPTYVNRPQIKNKN